MRRTYPTAMLLVAGLTTGCYGWRGIGAGFVSPSDGPPPVAAAGESRDLDLSYDAVISARASFCGFEDADPLATAAIGFNVGWFASGGGPHTEREWLIAQPLIGVWLWPDAPGEAGLAAGFELGVRAMILGSPKIGSIAVTASRLWLGRVDGDDGVWLRGVSVRYEVLLE